MPQKKLVKMSSVEGSTKLSNKSFLTKLKHSRNSVNVIDDRGKFSMAKNRYSGSVDEEIADMLTRRVGKKYVNESSVSCDNNLLNNNCINGDIQKNGGMNNNVGKRKWFFFGFKPKSAKANLRQDKRVRNDKELVVFIGNRPVLASELSQESPFENEPESFDRSEKSSLTNNFVSSPDVNHPGNMSEITDEVLNSYVINDDNAIDLDDVDVSSLSQDEIDPYASFEVMTESNKTSVPIDSRYHASLNQLDSGVMKCPLSRSHNSSNVHTQKFEDVHSNKLPKDLDELYANKTVILRKEEQRKAKLKSSDFGNAKIKPVFFRNSYPITNCSPPLPIRNYSVYDLGEINSDMSFAKKSVSLISLYAHFPKISDRIFLDTLGTNNKHCDTDVSSRDKMTVNDCNNAFLSLCYSNPMYSQVLNMQNTINDMSCVNKNDFINSHSSPNNFSSSECADAETCNKICNFLEKSSKSNIANGVERSKSNNIANETNYSSLEQASSSSSPRHGGQRVHSIESGHEQLTAINNSIAVAGVAVDASKDTPPTSCTSASGSDSCVCTCQEEPILMSFAELQNLNKSPPVCKCNHSMAVSTSLITHNFSEKNSQDGVKHEDSYHAFRDLMKELKECGWYWGPMSGSDAERKMAGKPDGSFLVRDSQNDNYILSLTFQSEGHTRHARIECSRGVFAFWSQPETHGRSNIKDFIEQVMENSRTGHFRYFLRAEQPGTAPVAIYLQYPISRLMKVPSLRHFSRFAIREIVRRDHITRLPIPIRLQEYLREPQYLVEDLDFDDEMTSL